MHIIYMHLQISCVKIDRSQFVSEGTKWLLQPRSLADLDVKILEEKNYSHQRIWGCEGHTRRVPLKGVEHRSQKAPEITIQLHCGQNALYRSNYRIIQRQNVPFRLIAFKISLQFQKNHRHYFHISRGKLPTSRPFWLSKTMYCFFSLQFQISLQRFLCIFNRQNVCLRDIVFKYFFSEVTNRLEYRQNASFRDIVFNIPLQF